MFDPPDSFARRIICPNLFADPPKFLSRMHWLRPNKLPLDFTRARAQSILGFLDVVLMTLIVINNFYFVLSRLALWEIPQDTADTALL